MCWLTALHGALLGSRSGSKVTSAAFCAAHVALLSMEIMPGCTLNPYQKFTTHGEVAGIRSAHMACDCLVRAAGTTAHSCRHSVVRRATGSDTLDKTDIDYSKLCAFWIPALHMQGIAALQRPRAHCHVLQLVGA